MRVSGAPRTREVYVDLAAENSSGTSFLISVRKGAELTLKVAILWGPQPFNASQQPPHSATSPTLTLNTPLAQ